MYRKTGEEDEYDSYEGNDEDALDHISGEIDFDRFLENSQDLRDLDDPKNCECWEESSDTCFACEHAIECGRNNCTDAEHVLTLKFGSPSSCPCNHFANAVQCGGCGHNEVCYQELLIDCEAGRHSEWVAYMNLDFCECEEEQSKDRCAECSHAAHCENTSFCGSKEFHQLISAIDEVEDEMPAAPGGDLPNAGKHWAISEDEQLIREYSASMAISEIAQDHGRSERSIWMRLVHLSFQNDANVADTLKIRKFELIEWQDGQIIVLRTSYLAGVSPATLAQVLERNVVDVAKKIVELGLANPKVLPNYRQVKNFRRWTSAELTQLREDFRNKLPIDLMAENAGRSKYAVLSTLYSLGEISDNEVNGLIQDASSTAYGD